MDRTCAITSQREKEQTSTRRIDRAGGHLGVTEKESMSLEEGERGTDIVRVRLAAEDVGAIHRPHLGPLAVAGSDH